MKKKRNPYTDHNKNKKMYFHGGYEEVILFDFWRINTLSGLIASMVACFMFSVFHEFLSIYLENCKRRENASKYTNLVEESRIFKKSHLKQKLSDCALCSQKGAITWISK